MLNVSAKVLLPVHHTIFMTQRYPLNNSDKCIFKMFIKQFMYFPLLLAFGSQNCLEANIIIFTIDRSYIFSDEHVLRLVC